MSSPDPSTHKRIGRGVRNFESAAWDREKQNAVLSGNYAKFTQNPAMKRDLLSTGKNGWPSPAFWTQYGALVSRRMIPEPMIQASGEGKICSVRRFLPFAKKFATVRPGWHARSPLVGSVLPRRMLESTKFRPRRSRAR